MARCPGQDLTNKSPEDRVSYHKCPGCGYQVEFFFDDNYRKCPGCGIMVQKTAEQILKNSGCAAWCTHAEQCLGSEAYQRIKAVEKKESGGGLEGIAEDCNGKTGV